MELGMSAQCNTVPSMDIGCRNTMPTVEERLLRRKSDLESQLEDINNALSALQANPEVLKIMCLISKVNY